MGAPQLEFSEGSVSTTADWGGRIVMLPVDGGGSADNFYIRHFGARHGSA
jgi:hypothetical protein